MASNLMKALITGITGQDGSYLAQHLLEKGYEVWGLVRGLDNPKEAWLQDLAPGVCIAPGDLLDELSLYNAVCNIQPDEVYNFAAVSSPALAWQQPVLTAETTGIGALRVFEAVRKCAPQARVLQAGSIANHGPYGAAKLFAQKVAEDFRERGLHVSCAVFGGHHSPRRSPSFFARKVTAGVASIAAGRSDHIVLGALNRSQDWGWAPDFVKQLPHLLTLTPDDYVMSTNDPHSAKEWVDEAFAVKDMDWREWVKFDAAMGNVTDVPALTATPDPRLRWQPNLDFKGLIRWMVEEDGRG